MHFSRTIVVMLICCTPLFSADAPTPPESPRSDAISLSKMIAPFAKISMDQHGIFIPALGCSIKWSSHNADYIATDYTHTSSSEFDITNGKKPHKKLWIHDPQKTKRMPRLLHHATGSFLLVDLFLNRPTVGTLDYQIEACHETDTTLTIINCIVFPNAMHYLQGRIICEQPLDVQRHFNNHLFSNLQTLGLCATRLVGQRPLLTLCICLPKLTELHIMNTEFEDTELTLVHNKLTRCKIDNCGITKIGSVIAPQLRHWSLSSNKLTQFNIHTLDMQPCNIDLRNNAIELVHREENDSLDSPVLYLNLRGNPLKKEETYKAIFQKKTPSAKPYDPHRSFCPILLEHDDFTFLENGEVVVYKKNREL